MITGLKNAEDTSEAAIYVVDDDEAVRDSISALLEINDRHVRTFPSAKLFLEHFDGDAYCLLLDVQMPGMTGLELVSHLAVRSQLPPTVLLTAHSEEYATQEILSLGVHAILPKPTSEEVLLAAIDSAAEANKGNPL